MDKERVVILLFIILNAFTIYNYYLPSTQTNTIQYLPIQSINKESPSYHITGIVDSPDEVTVYGKNMTIMVATGNSMLPVSRNDTYTIVEQYFTPSNLTVGDIVVYRKNTSDFDGYIDHRIVWMNDTHFIARGDNNPVDDAIQPISSIKGIVVGIIY